MQRLSAPTREEIDKAHRKGDWLDVAVPSARNLWRINRWRGVGWLLLAISSLPLHLLYNSVIFTEINAIAYRAFVVDKSFVYGSSFSVADAEDNRMGDTGYTYRELNKSLRWLQERATTLSQMSPTLCIKAYSPEIQTVQGDALLITEMNEPTNNSYYFAFNYSPWAK